MRIRTFQEAKLNVFSWSASLVTGYNPEVTDFLLGPGSQIPKASKKPLIDFKGFFRISFLSLFYWSQGNGNYT